jgi:hypothetical protein
VDYISARDALCDDRGCVTRVNGSLTARDDVHLTPAGSEFLVTSIAQQLGIAH